MLASWLECHEHLYQEDYQQQVSCSCGEEPDYHLITIAKGIKVTHAVAMNVMLQLEVEPGTLKKLDEIQGIQQTRMSV